MNESVLFPIVSFSVPGNEQQKAAELHFKAMRRINKFDSMICESRKEKDSVSPIKGKMDYRTHQKESCRVGNLLEKEPVQQPLQHEIPDKTLCPQFLQEGRAHSARLQLRTILEALPNEEVHPGDDLPTSFVDVENRLARCISECLIDVPSQMRDVDHVQSLLRVYRVVQPLLGGTHTVSLHRVHVILQDNFPDSWLCLLMNMTLAGWMDTTSMTVAI